MQFYRIDRRKYLDQVLLGLGAARHGGRWNERETPALYGSESRALALLEILVQARSNVLMPNDRVIVTIDIPDNKLLRLKKDDLPAYWNSLPQPHPNTKQLFQQHCVLGERLGLFVPSVILPEEYNVVLYPLHKEYLPFVKVVDVQPLQWDARLS